MSLPPTWGAKSHSLRVQSVPSPGCRVTSRVQSHILCNTKFLSLPRSKSRPSGCKAPPGRGTKSRPFGAPGESPRVPGSPGVALAVPWVGWGLSVAPCCPRSRQAAAVPSRAEPCRAPKVAAAQGRAETVPDILQVPSCGGGGKSQSVNVCSAL